MIGFTRRTAAWVGAGLLVLVPGVGAVTPREPAQAVDTTVLWAVADLCANNNAVPGCRDVADLVVDDPTTSYFAVLGDAQTKKGTLAEFNTYYHPKVGARLDDITKPIPGNHEYATANAAGYYSYFGAAAGDPTKGYYSFSENGWTMIFLNSNCGKISAGCNYKSVQAKWLDQQLQRPETCEIIFTHHHPMSDGSSSAAHPSGTPNMRSFFRHAYENGAELFMSGHHHSYQRFSPRNSSFAPATDGVVPIVAGTGGTSLHGFGTTDRSEYRQNDEYGAVRLDLTPTGYSGAFVNIDRETMDSFSGSCHS